MPAYIITGPTSGIGRATAFELARHGTLVLVGRDRAKLDELKAQIERGGHEALSVVCDLSDLTSVRRAVAEIAAMRLPIAGLLNNAGIFPMRPAKNAIGWDLAFVTNHLGPFALTDALMAHLPDGARVVFVASAVEDPERRPAKAVGFRGARYITAEASARGEWKSEGSKLPGADAYATSKQCNLATMSALARDVPRLRFAAVEPGVIPTTSLSGGGSGVASLVAKLVVPPLVWSLMPFMKFLSTPERAAKVIVDVLIDATGPTGVYYDEGGRPMLGSTLVRDPDFQDRVVTETRALIATVD